MVKQCNLSSGNGRSAHEKSKMGMEDVETTTGMETTATDNFGESSHQLKNTPSQAK